MRILLELRVVFKQSSTVLVLKNIFFIISGMVALHELTAYISASAVAVMSFSTPTAGLSLPIRRMATVGEMSPHRA